MFIERKIFMEKKVLGKIKEVHFGCGGYQNMQIGISFVFENKEMEVEDFWGYWSIERIKGAEWTERNRIEHLGKMCMRIHKLLTEAKVLHIDNLKNIPVEMTIDGNMLKSWRILTEVL